MEDEDKDMANCWIRCHLLRPMVEREGLRGAMARTEHTQKEAVLASHWWHVCRHIRCAKGPTASKMITITRSLRSMVLCARLLSALKNNSCHLHTLHHHSHYFFNL